MSNFITIKNAFKFRKVKAEERGDLIKEGVPVDQIEDIVTGEGEAAKVTHIRRKALELAFKVPSVAGMLEEGEKGISALQTLINQAANGIMRKLVDSGETLADELEVTFADISDYLTPTRKTSKAQRVTGAQLKDVCKLFAEWCLETAGKSEKATSFMVSHMQNRFSPAVMSSLKEGMVEAVISNMAQFAEDMSDSQTADYGHVVNMLVGNLEEAMDYEPEEVDLSDL